MKKFKKLSESERILLAKVKPFISKSPVSNKSSANPKSLSALTGYCIFFGAIIVIILVVIFLNTGSFFSKSFIHDTFHGWNDNSAASKSQIVSAPQIQPASAPQIQPASAPQNQNVSVPQVHQTVVKGFYIGMPAAEVLQGITNLLLGVYEIKREGSWDIISVVTPVLYNQNQNQMFFFLDSYPDGKLIGLKFGKDIVNRLFSVADLNVSEFADNFATAYKLPAFQFRVTPDGGSEYKCVSPDNVEITISNRSGHEKELQMQSASDNKGNFN